MDKLAYAIAYFISISLAIIIMYLTIAIRLKDFPLENIIYIYIISAVIFLIFLIYEYSKSASFQKKLKDMMDSSNILENILNIGEVRNREQKLIKDVLKKLHSFCEMKISKYEESQRQYLYFINQWVHQMKTPVSVINLILQDEKTTEYKEIFDSIGEENEKISQGLNIMLYNARINEFNHDFNVESIDVIEIVRKVINDNKKLLIHQGIFPKVTGEAAAINTDKKWIYFVINQIVINAIKYTSAAVREKKVINFTLLEDNSKVTLSIEDNGIGIPKEDLGRVFNAFFTGKNGRKTSESTGMGMYLSKRICTELGHKIEVEAEIDKGTKFCITFYKGKDIYSNFQNSSLSKNTTQNNNLSKL